MAKPIRPAKDNGDGTFSVPLTQGMFAIVDEADIERVRHLNWKFANGYARRSDGKGPMHRYLLNAPEGVQVDHINNNRLDNRRSNVRLCTQDQNVRNVGMRGSNTTGFKGVTLRKKTGRYLAQIGFAKRKIYIGSFGTADEAARAYDKVASSLFREFAQLNFSTETA